MSAITVDGDLVHYEKLGRGRPVILVHGWIGSWRYWVPLMQQISTKYSVYAVDLFGFGDSSKNKVHYSIDQQVRLLREFMAKLGIPKADVVGHALGGMVLVEFARQHPDKIARMLVSSMPLFDPGNLDSRIPAGVQVPLKAPQLNIAAATEETKSDNHSAPATPESEAKKSDDESKKEPVAAPITSTETAAKEVSSAASSNHIVETKESAAVAVADKPESDDESETGTNKLLELFSGTTLADLLTKAFKKSESHFDKLKVDVDKTDNLVLTHSAQTYDAGKMLDHLRELKMPVVMVHGENDPIFPLPQIEVWNYLQLNKDETLIPFQLNGIRHFPMLESMPFLQLVNEFLSVDEITRLELKEHWIRPHR